MSSLNTDELRLRHEIEHGRYLVSQGAGEVWNWESAAGRVRWRRRIQMLTQNLRPQDHVLELGCGTGYFSKELVKCPIQLTAIDISDDLLSVAREQIQCDNGCFMRENAYALSFSAESFDHIVGSSVLHHLDLTKGIAEMYRVLRPGGTISFTEPNMLNPQIAAQKNIAWLKRRMGDSPDETAFFRWQLAKKIKAAGFSKIQIVPFDFLHPALPAGSLSFMQPVCTALEKIPLVREIAGSLYIQAQKDAD